MESVPLRLKWRKTWPDYEADFCVDSPIEGATIGRIMLTIGGPKDRQWQWTYQAAIKGLPWNQLHHSGFEATARQAAKVIEDMWFAATAGKRFDEASRAFVEE